MLSSIETSNYERSSNVAAGLCAACFKSLDADEVHVCEQCERKLSKESGSG